MVQLFIIEIFKRESSLFHYTACVSFWGEFQQIGKDVVGGIKGH